MTIGMGNLVNEWWVLGVRILAIREESNRFTGRKNELHNATLQLDTSV